MRLRYISVTYAFGGTSQSLERHYRELREELLHPGRHYGLIQPAQWRPPVDIHESPDAILVKIELAGMNEEHIECTLYENALVVTGRRDDDAVHDETLYYHEAQVHYGPFRAEILLPTPVRADETEVTYRDGFLRVRMPKVVATEAEVTGNARRGEPGSTSGVNRKLNAAPAGDTPGHAPDMARSKALPTQPLR
jgi:HSP20 family molecular chaperone IbpA